MTSASFDPEAVIDALAPLLGLAIPPDHRPGVATNLRIAAAMAALVLGEAVGDHEDAAPVFTPVALRPGEAP